MVRTHVLLCLTCLLLSSAVVCGAEIRGGATKGRSPRRRHATTSVQSLATLSGGKGKGGVGATPTPAPLDDLSASYCVLEANEAYSLFNLFNTSVYEVGTLLTSDDTIADDSLRSAIEVVLQAIPEDEFQDIFNDESYVLEQLMLRGPPPDSSENRLLQDVSSDCIVAIINTVVAFLSNFLSTIGLNSVAGTASRVLANRISGNPAFQRIAIGIATSNTRTPTQKVFDIAALVMGELSVGAIVEAISDTMSFVDWAIIAVSVAINVAALALRLSTPFGIALFFADKAAAVAAIVSNIITMGDKCGPTPPPTNPPTPEPTMAPVTPDPTNSPTNSPTPDPTTQSPTPDPTTNAPSSPPVTPSPSPPPPPDDMGGNTRATSDPHFRTWRGRFSYQGACDLVYIRTNKLEVHIRLSFGNTRRSFSFVSSVAMAIGGDVLEILSNRSYYLNGTAPNSPPALIGNRYPFSAGSSFRIDLSGGQYIRVSFYRGTITLDVTGYASDFGSSTGFAGSFFSNAVFSRNGTILDRSLSTYANEWIVNPQLGDAVLFVEPTSVNGTVCTPPGTPAAVDPALQMQAETACANLPDDATRMECIFDVTTTGDSEWAQNPGFTEPLDELQPLCVSITGSEEGACAGMGGTCTWRCNSLENLCLNGLCEPGDIPIAEFDVAPPDTVDGCSCAIPIVPTESPTSFPTVGQSTLNQVITCISVIDESSVSGSVLQNRWTTFRESYPNRPFCLLQPQPNSQSELRIPSAFFEDPLANYSSVSRDFGDPSSASDWFTICGLQGLKAQGIINVAIFIDNSGSLTTSEVQASYDLLQERMEMEGLILVAGISNSIEDWIAPFISDF